MLHVTIKHHHNHRLGCSEALQQRDVARETTGIGLFVVGDILWYFLSLFFANHMPGSEINMCFCEIGTQEQAETTTSPTPQDGSRAGEASSQSALVAEHLKGRLRSMFDGLMDKLERDHETFQAPIESLVSSYDKIHTDGGLISALYIWEAEECCCA